MPIAEKMGSEQSQPANAQRNSNNSSRLQRGHTIAVSGRRLSSPNDEPTSQVPSESRPVSPPISVCSDSDLPYVSYTDKLGGEFTFFVLIFCNFSYFVFPHRNAPILLSPLTLSFIIIYRLAKTAE